MNLKETQMGESNLEEVNFDRLFKQISPEEISDSVFTLVREVFPVITAGKEDHFNSMTASGGGMGILFRKPTTWCILQTGRYTLELIQKEQTSSVRLKSRRSL
jgi:hypothetical protein